MVGRARQGKSRLLQSLTGLTTTEIPDGDRQHCTGVRSTIRHNPDMATYGEVYFYSELSFLNDVIAPYYEKLNLGAKPNNLVEFASKSLPPLPENLPGYAEPGAMYEHLTRYHNNIDKYVGLLNSPPRRISSEEIREYVAQDTVDGERIFFNYLAVKEVKITCSFPNSEVGQIALVDMPGLGDTGVGDEGRLIKTLSQDIDAVLFVRMPSAKGDYWTDVDVRLYDTARTAIIDLPLDLWSFMILNQTNANSSNSDNLHQETVYKCQEALADLSSEPKLAVFAAVEEFIDQVLRGEEIKNEWPVFLYEVRPQVWPTYFKPMGEGSDSLKEWQKLVEIVAQTNQLELFQFINYANPK